MGYRQLSVVFFVLLCQLAFSSSLCPKDQSISLLKFKETLIVRSWAFGDCVLDGKKYYPKTSLWNMSRDCCLWDGVKCNEMTGHVIELDLGCSQLSGIIDSNSSLFQLSHLQRLNLSFNYFYGSQISPKFGRFSSLTHLDLYASDFSGQIPSEISHLSKLQSLSLMNNNLRLATHDFKLLLQNLTQLRELDLSFINISSTIPPNISSHLTTLRMGQTGLYGIMPESIFHLPNLETLDLQWNYQLSGYFPKTKWNSSASLKELSLDDVNFFDNLPESLGYLTLLHSLSLQNCNLNRSIPSGILSLPSLHKIDLSDNYVSGKLEDFKSNSLVWIDLGGNQLQGHFPKSIQNLVNLTWLDISFNNFSGNVDVSLFSDLQHLLSLSLSYNRISLTNENTVSKI